MPDELSFEAVVEAHYASLYRFAFSLTRNENDACDLTQQTFYVWAAKGHQLKDAAKVKPWLFTTLHRQFLEQQRKGRRFPHHHLEEVPEELPGIEPDMVTNLDVSVILQALSRMDPNFQAPVALCYLEDYSYQEIAGILDIPLGTVKSRIARGLMQLQRAFQEIGAKPDSINEP